METRDRTLMVSESDSDDEPLIKLAKRSSSQLSTTSQSSTSNTSNSPTTEEKSSISNALSSSKPLTAFAHFFNDTQHSIRKKNSTATFGEVSQVVTSMWESLEANAKLLYQKREEEDKNRFEKCVHSIVPELIEKSSTETDEVVNEPAESVNTAEPVAVTETVTDDNTCSTEDTAEPSNTQAMESSSLKKPLIISTIPKQNTIITLTGSNKIVVTNKPLSSAAPPPDAATTLRNVKGITIIHKPATTSESLSPVPKQEVRNQLSFTAVTGARKTTQTTEIAASGTPSPTGSTSSVSELTGSSTNSVSELTGSSTSSTTLEECKEGRASTTPSPQQKMCKYSMCDKPSIKHDKWDEDFCSSKCVVQHCHERFKAWVTARA